MPAEDRAETKIAFAATIGVTTRTIDRWVADNREFAQALDKARKAYDTSPDFYALCVRHKALALINEGLEMPIGEGKGKLSSSERRQYIAAALAETKQVSDSMDTIDRTHLSDHELVAEFLSRNLADGTPALIECVDILKGEIPCSTSSTSAVESSLECSVALSDTSTVAPIAKKPKKPREKRGKMTGRGRPGVKVPKVAST